MDAENSPKARGKQSRISKKKSDKNRHTVAPSKPKTVLESNWDRYDEQPTENKISNSTNFAVLANTPISHGSHFQFKHDKDIDLEISQSVESSKNFNLDLTILNRSLSSIPFHVRSGIDVDYFGEFRQKCDKVEDYSSGTEDPDVIFESPDLSESKYVTVSDKIDDLGTQNTSTATHSKRLSSTDNDLEQWLDDILDD